MHIIQRPLFDFDKFIAQVKEEEGLIIVLEGLDVEKLLVALERERWTGRKGHSVRGMWARPHCGGSAPKPHSGWCGAIVKGE